MERFSRSALLIGEGALLKLKNSRVAVFGVGGVGGYAVEALVRSGLGAIDLIDADTISVSNINRQLLALNSTVGRFKTDVAKERALDINPDCAVTAYRLFYGAANTEIDFSVYDALRAGYDKYGRAFPLPPSPKTSSSRWISWKHA